MDIRKKIMGICFVSCEKTSIIRLMNICCHRKIKIWNTKKDSGRGFYIYRTDMPKVLELSEKCCIPVSISEHAGINDTVIYNIKRLSLMAGVLLFALAIYVESLYIWHIEINGCINYTEEEILNMINMEYPCYGTKKNNVDMKELRNMLMENFDDICWASCSISGTKLRIDICESPHMFSCTDLDEPCNLVASMDCTIYSIVTSSGTPVAKAGDEVNKGDILISGAVNIMNDDSEIVDTRYVTAGGEVYGICKIDYSDEIPAIHYRKNITDQKTGQISISLGRKKFSLYSRKDESVDHDVVSEQHIMHIGDLYLPLKVTTCKWNYYDVETLKYTPEEQKKQAEHNLMTYIGKMKEKGVQIIQKNVIITSGTLGITAEGDITVKLPVGVPEVIDRSIKQPE